MSIICPHKGLKKWSDLVALHGEAKSYFLWNEFEGKVPKEFYSENSNVQVSDKDLEPYYKYSPQEPKVPLIQKVPKVNFNSKFAAGTKLVERQAGEINAKYDEMLPPNSIKRQVANKFFRYAKYDKDGNNSPVYYPFKVSDSWEKNKQYKDAINKLYSEDVVGVDNDGSIVFRPNIENAIYTGGDFGYAVEPVDTDVGTIESPDTKAIDTAIERLNERLALLTRRASKTGGSSQMRANIADLKSQIKKLEENKTTLASNNILERFAKNDAVQIQDNLDNIRENVDTILKADLREEKTKQQMLALMDSLMLNSITIQGWIDIQDFVEHSDPELINELEKISGHYSRLNREWNDLAKTLFTEYANRYSYRDNFSKDELFDAVKDTSIYKSNVLGLSESHIELLKVVDDIIRKSASDINEESFDKKSEVREWNKKLKEDGFSESEVNDIFKQKHNGDWTGNIIGDIDHSYYVKKQELFDEANRTGKYARVNKWLKDNSKSLNLKQLRDIKEGNFESSKNIGYSQEELDIQKELLEKYQEDHDTYQEITEMKYGNSEFAQRELEEWELAHSPFLYAQGEKNSGYKYLIKEKPSINKWGDRRFDKIKNNPTLFGFYNFMKQRFNENNKALGYFNAFEEFYMPEKESNFAKQLMQNKGLLKKVGFLGNSIKNSISQSASETFPAIHIKGKPVKSVPIRMMQNRIPPQIKEDHLLNIINLHTENSLAHKYKTEIEPMCNAATELLNTIKELKPGDKEIENQLANAKKQLEYAKDAGLYDERKSRIEGKTGVKFYTDEEKQKLAELKQQRSNKKITEETFNQEKDKLGKMITGNKLVDSLINYTYIKAMSFPNVITPGVNVLFGINSNLIYASAGVDVDLKTMNKAMIQMMSATARSFGAKNNPELVEKVYAFMEKLHLLGTIHDNEYGSRKSFSEKLTILQEKAEHFNQGSLMLAILQYQKLLDKNGKEVSIFDAYKVQDEKLVWNEELMGKQTNTPNSRVISEDKHGVNLFGLTKYIDRINATVHGDYKSPMMAKKNAALRMLMLFKTWLPKAIDHRFGTQRLDKDLINKEGFFGRDVKGRYLSFWNSTTMDAQEVLFKDTLGMILKSFVSKKAFDKLSDIDRVNMMRNMREIKHLIAIYGGLLMMRGLLMDDDDDNKPILNITLNMLSKTGQDMSFFLSPNSMSQMVDNIIPVYSTVRDGQRAINNAFGLLTGDVFYQNGPWKDSPKLAVNTFRMIPGSSGAIKMWNMGNKFYQY